MANRRTFLKLLSSGVIGSSLGSALLLTQGCSHKQLLNPDADIILAGGSFDEDGSTQNALILLIPKQKEKKLILTEFLPHGIIIDPTNKYRILCFEKNGKRACEIDLFTRSVSQQRTSSEGQLFSGHGVFSLDGQQLYTIETNSNNQQGSIAVRDAKTFELIKRLPTLGLNPHYCQLLKDNTLVVSHTGQDASALHRPSLVYINMDTEKLVKRLKLDDDTLNCGHFAITKENNLVVASAPVDVQSNPKTINGGISIQLSGQTITTIKEPVAVTERMTGEALGISINEKHQVVAVTHPEANLLSFWSLKDKKIIKAIGIENPRGIEQSLDKKNFIVSYGGQSQNSQSAIASVTVDTLMPQVDSIVQPTHASGEHILNWSRNLREIMPRRVYD